MLKLLRLLILFIVPLVFLAVWYAVPSILSPSRLMWLSGIVTILWALEFYFFQRLNFVSQVQGLSASEHGRLVLRLDSIRRRVWWIGAIGVASSLLIWFMAAMSLPATSPVYATMVGFLVGVSVSYLILIPFWIGESQHFIEEMALRESQRKRAEDAIEKLSPKD